MRVVLRGIVQKATTLVDGGWRVSFDLPDHAPVEELMQLRGEDLAIVAMPYSQVSDEPEDSDNAVDR